jgi:lipoate-protein ligase B
LDREAPRWLWLDCGLVDYGRALSMQRRLVAGKIAGRLAVETVLALEHPPVFTLGRRGGRDNLLVSEAFLADRGVEVVPVERGGDITYHGPGQLVVYPIARLRSAGLSVAGYVDGLEAAVIRTAARWGVAASTNPVNRGVWVGNAKMASVGITVRRGVAFHGLAFNVNTDLTPFSWIHPCGLRGVCVTSMAEQTGAPLPMASVAAALRKALGAALGVSLREADGEERDRILEAGQERGGVEASVSSPESPTG